MRVTVNIRVADSVEAEEAAGRTGQPVPKSVIIELDGESLSVLEEIIDEELSGMGFGGLDFEILDVIS